MKNEGKEEHGEQKMEEIRKCKRNRCGNEEEGENRASRMKGGKGLKYEKTQRK